MEFEVEKILRKKIKSGETKYFLKWIGFGNMHNSWEPIANLNCAELIDEFEKGRPGNVIGVKRQGNELVYIINFDDTRDFEKVSSNQATQYWPQKIIQFLEQKIEWIQSTSNNNDCAVPIETQNPKMDVVPQQILYATNISGKLLMWVQWAGGITKYIKAEDANKMWPTLVIRYYEKNIHFD